MKLNPTDGAMVLALWRHEGVSKSPRILSEKLAALTETQIIGTTAGVIRRATKKSKTIISDEAERKRRDKALDEAIENTFPASDPVSVEQPL